MAQRVLSSLKKTVESSKFISKLSEWYADNMGYRQLGLRLDDMVPDESPIVAEALRRLPPDEFQLRNFRFARAFNLNVSKAELPKDQWTTSETDVAYLRPLISLVESEVALKEHFDNLTSVPAALKKRNRSS